MERSRVQLSAFILAAALLLPWHPCGAQSTSGCPVQVRHIKWQASGSGFSPYKHRGLEIHLQYRYCPVKSRTESVGWDRLAAELCSLSAEGPVKWAFSRTE